MSVMKVGDVVSGQYGRCFLNIDGRRYDFMMLTNVTLKATKTKSKLRFLGRASAANKTTGVEITGSCEYYYCTSLMARKVVELIKTGKDFYFDMQIINKDPNSSVEEQVAIAKDCNIDSAVLAKLDVDASDALKANFDFTAESADITTEFSEIPGM